jgi:diguanylate cyclase (GGDEF)-like protein/PAS domain S-box-containing protein
VGRFGPVTSRGAKPHDATWPAEHGLLDWIPDGVVVTDRAGRIVFANPQAERLTGFSQRDLLGRGVEELVPERLGAVHKRHRERYQAAGSGAGSKGRTEGDFRVRRKDGTEFSAEIALGPIETPSGPQTVALIRDISERVRFETLLEHRALHDPLTDLANRSLFFDRLNQSLQGARREGRKVALVMLDLDGFKAVNDSFGHPVGDELLKQVAQRLQDGLRATDTAARIGGDEFAWILPRVAGREAAQVMVRKRLSKLRGIYSVRNESIEVGVSAGIALYPDDGRDVNNLIRNADSAMYSAKREGRDLVFHLTPRARGRSARKR